MIVVLLLSSACVIIFQPCGIKSVNIRIEADEEILLGNGIKQLLLIIMEQETKSVEKMRDSSHTFLLLSQKSLYFIKQNFYIVRIWKEMAEPYGTELAETITKDYINLLPYTIVNLKELKPGDQN